MKQKQSKKMLELIKSIPCMFGMHLRKDIYTRDSVGIMFGGKSQDTLTVCRYCGRRDLVSTENIKIKL